MPSTCADIGCANRGSQDLGISYHRFPLNDPELLKAWMEKLPCRDWKISTWSKLCSLHFVDNCLYQLTIRRTSGKEVCQRCSALQQARQNGHLGSDQDRSLTRPSFCASDRSTGIGLNLQRGSLDRRLIS
ncbi:hypothetical protein HPB47_013967 [Ixodes persulcatus]|uniref:Uncharacterized protein n=1 Tax=Ixodes persulcatus TaxID=34615 RepID=A0AC60QY96_IXOPE|nr:hypothetical protein HPB47_013967 [Ixodes persulcatus]